MRHLFLVLLALIASGCGLFSSEQEEPPPPPPGDGFVHETLPARCFSSVPGRSIVPLGSDPDVFAMHYGVAPEARVMHANSSLITRDGGRTFQKIVGDFDLGGSERRRGALGSIVNPIVISEDFWVALGGVGLPGTRSWLVLILDGAAVEVNGQSFSARMPDGIAADRVWKGDARRWVARSEGFLFASRDGGATWEQVGPAPYLGNGTHWPIAWMKDRAVHVQPGRDYQGYLSVRGQPRQPITWRATLVQGSLANARRATYWNGLLVGSVYTEVLTTPDTQSWKILKTDPKASAQLSFFIDRRNRLWAYPDSPSGDRDDTKFKVYRWEPDQETPVVVDFDFGGLSVLHLGTPFELPDGRLRFVAAVEPIGRHQGVHRDVHGYMLCEAGPGITPGFEPVVTEPIDAAAAGHVALVERFGTASEQRTRLAISRTGRIFATGHQQLFGGPPDMPPVYEIGRVDVPFDPNLDGIPTAPYGAGESTVGAIISRGRSPSLLVAFDARTGERVSSIELPEEFDVFDARVVLNQLFFKTERETVFANKLGWVGPGGLLPPRLPGSMVFSGRHAALVEGLRYGAAAHQPSQYTLRFDPAGFVPDISICYTEPRPATCVPHHDTIVTDAEMGPDGTLYLLDWMHGRVLSLAPEATEYVEVARGFVVPQDLALRSVGEETVVLVADGDVFAFVPRPGEVKVRGGSAPPTPIAVPFLAERDRLDCAAEGPCLDSVPEPGIILSGSACITGVRLGAQAGRVFAGSLEATVTEWSETRVCFQVDGEARDGLLRVVRADGVMANRLGYLAPGFVTEWLVPDRVTPRTVIRIKGRNLQNAQVGGAQLVASADGYVDLRVPFPGTSTVTVQKGTTTSVREITVAPEVLHACRTGPSEVCELEGIGFGSGSSLPAFLAERGYTATVGGQAAMLTFWDDLRVRFVMPALPPGLHPVVLRHPSGFEVTAQVEVPSISPEVLVADQPLNGALRYAHSRPARTELGVVAPVDMWSYGTVGGIRTPLQFDGALVFPGTQPRDGRLPTHDSPVSASRFSTLLEKGKPLHVLPVSGGYVVASQKAGRADVLELVRVFSDTTPQQVLELGGMGGMQVSGAGFVGDRLVIVASSTVSGASKIIEVEVGASLAQLATSSVAYSAFSGDGNSTIPAAGAWVTPRGVYFGSCRRFDKPAALRFLPLTVNGDGSLTFGSLQTVLDANGRILACNTTEDGLLWVRRDGAGEHVEQHTAAGLEFVATLPASLPGVGESWTFLAYKDVPGVLDLARLPNGELLFVLNENESTPRGLRLARRHADGTFSFSAIVTPQTLLQLGERCVGPSYWTNLCERTAMDGCAPFACSLRPWHSEQRASDRIGTAILTPFGSDASEALVVYEVVATTKTKAHVYGGTEVHAVKLAVP